LEQQDEGRKRRRPEMADESPNQPESKSSVGLVDRVKEEIKPFQKKLETDLEGLKTPQKTQLY
jgi:hypothetical protein